MIEFLKFLWLRYVQRCRNIGYGKCGWICSTDPYYRNKKQCILLDENMCQDCYWNDYALRYK